MDAGSASRFGNIGPVIDDERHTGGFQRRHKGARLFKISAALGMGIAQLHQRGTARHRFEHHIDNAARGTQRRIGDEIHPQIGLPAHDAHGLRGARSNFGRR